MNANVNHLFREHANEIVAEVARRLNRIAPRCVRVNRRRGRAHVISQQFSLPRWALATHPAYRRYYILHEACHCFAGTHGHGSEFHRLENELCEAEGLRLVFSSGPYPSEIREIGTGWPLCDGLGRAL